MPPRGSAHYKWKPKVEKTCLKCGKEFLAFPYRAATAKYCSASCRSSDRAGPTGSNWKGGMIEKACLNCGRPFSVYPGRAETSRFCSHACASALGRITGTKAPWWRGGKIERPCAHCGKVIMVNPGDRRRRFCSRECASGPQSHLWRGGVFKSEYPASFSRSFKRRIRSRDEYTCVVCGKHPAYDVHHIDYDKANTAEGNCVTLCHPCHSRTNINREHWEHLLASLLSP